MRNRMCLLFCYASNLVVTIIIEVRFGLWQSISLRKWGHIALVMYYEFLYNFRRYLFIHVPHLETSSIYIIIIIIIGLTFFSHSLRFS